MSSRGMKITQTIRAERRAKAEARQAEYDKLSLEEKIARLPKDGANKQRARLLNQLENKNNKVSESKVAVENEVSTDSPKAKISKNKNKKEDK